MPRRPERPRKTEPTPIDRKKNALLAEAEHLKAQLNQTRKFLQKAPDLKAEAQKKAQEELIHRYHRPTRIDGPADFRLELVGNKPARKPRTLRHERSYAPYMTFALLLACAAVFYYAMKILGQQ